MARGRKKELNLTLEEQLEKLQIEIEEDVYRAFLDSGKTLEDLKILLTESQPLSGEPEASEDWYGNAAGWTCSVFFSQNYL